MRRVRLLSTVLVAAALLGTHVCDAATTTALDLTSSLARDHGYCVVSPLLERELGEVGVTGDAPDAAATIELLEQAGLSVYTAGTARLAVVCDLRPGRERDGVANRIALAGDFPATLPPSVIQRQREAVGSTRPSRTCR